MSYTQMTGMRSTRFPLSSLSGCGCGARSLGQEPGPTRGSALGAAVTVAVLGTIVYLTLNSPDRYGSGGYYDHRLGKWVSANRRRRRSRRWN